MDQMRRCNELKLRDATTAAVLPLLQQQQLPATDACKQAVVARKHQAAAKSCAMLEVSPLSARLRITFGACNAAEDINTAQLCSSGLVPWQRCHAGSSLTSQMSLLTKQKCKTAAALPFEGLQARLAQHQLHAGVATHTTLQMPPENSNTQAKATMSYMTSLDQFPSTD